MREIAMVPHIHWLAFALMTSLVACTSASRLPDSSVASQISMLESQLVVTRDRMDSSRQASERQPLPATLSEARRYLLEHSPNVRARLLTHQINVSDIAQNEGGYSNPALSIGRFSLPSDGFKRLVEIGLSLTDLFGVPSANRALELELALANLEFEAELFDQLLSLEQQWLDVGILQARVELSDYHVRFLSAMTALSADYLAAGNIAEAEHLDRALALSTEESALNLAQQALFSSKVQLANLLGVDSRSAMGLDVRLWDIQGDRIPPEDEALASAQAINRNLQAVKARIPLLENELEKRRWMRWLQNVGLSYEVEDEGERQEGPKLEFDVPIFDTQVDLLKAQTQRAKLGQLRAELVERDLEFSIISLTRSLDERGRVIRRLQEETLPLLERRASLLQREESYMLIDVFELAQARLEQIEQVDALLDISHAYWLDRLTLSHRMGLLLEEGEPLSWQDKLPGLREEKMNHSMHLHHEMGHEMNHGAGSKPDIEGHGGHEMHESMHSSHGDAHSGMHSAAHRPVKPDPNRGMDHEVELGDSSYEENAGHEGHEMHESVHSSHGDEHSGMHPASHGSVKPDPHHGMDHEVEHGDSSYEENVGHEGHEMHESLHSSHGDGHSGMSPASHISVNQEPHHGTHHGTHHEKNHGSDPSDQQATTSDPHAAAHGLGNDRDGSVQPPDFQEKAHGAHPKMGSMRDSGQHPKHHLRVEAARETPPPSAKALVTEKKNGVTHDH